MLLVSVFEELLIRGVIFRIAEHAWGSRRALVLSTVIFVAAHLPGEISLMGVLHGGGFARLHHCVSTQPAAVVAHGNALRLELPVLGRVFGASVGPRGQRLAARLAERPGLTQWSGLRRRGLSHGAAGMGGGGHAAASPRFRSRSVRAAFSSHELSWLKQQSGWPIGKHAQRQPDPQTCPVSLFKMTHSCRLGLLAKLLTCPVLENLNR